MSNVAQKYEEFRAVSKLMIKTNLSRNYDTLVNYREQIIPAYNEFIEYIAERYERVDAANQNIYDQWLLKARDRFIACLDALKCTYNLPTINEYVDDTHVGPVPDPKIEKPSTSAETNTNTNTDTDGGLDINSNNNNSDNSNDNNNTSNNNNNFDMGANAMTQLELFNVVNRQFKQNYSGDPLGLTPFLDSVDLLSDFATTDALRTNLLRYVTAKLEGRARELITNEVDSIDEFKRILRENISPESSEVIRGRIGALRYAYNRQEEFVAKAEELAEGLRRALHLEGMSAKMAHDTSVQETVRLCRRSTNSDLVKSILMSSQFKNPKEVIAKLVTESDAYVKEQQILRFERSNRTTNNRRNGNGQSNGNGRRGGQNNNGYNRNRGNGGGGQYNGNNQNRNNNGNGSQRRGNGGGGRGQARGGNGNGGSNHNGSNPRGHWQGNSNGSNHNVRIAQSGNDSSPQQAPPQMLMGAQFQNY